ncbi:O-antigen polymerase family protein [human gut metagenome]|uniref:O-antigen polymerase family protein n=1 Tax=human gut metagenome TaxID=408170 RepID=K1SAX6_9ZZZZ
MFMDSQTTISSMDSSSINFENIQSNGRELIWNTNLELFYKPNPITGAGLGESMEFTKENFAVKLIHNDYVQILCDTGLVGISLFAIFFVMAILKVTILSTQYKHNKLIRLSGAMALGSCAGVFFSMMFDNVISYAQQSFVIPFIFIGIFLKMIDLRKRQV